MTREDAAHRVGELTAVLGYCGDSAPDELWAQSELLSQFSNIGTYEDAVWEIYDRGAQQGAVSVVSGGCSAAIQSMLEQLESYRF